jgi:alkylhydroperoxidase family enzyme
MAWIEMIEPERSEGALKEEYEHALQRAGKVYNIVKIQSLNSRVLHSSMQAYITIMHSPSELTRAEREMLATVVSSVNHCFY